MAETVTASYDEQREICQALVSWIRTLDRNGAIDCVPLDARPVAEHHASLKPAWTRPARAGDRNWSAASAVSALPQRFPTCSRSA